MLILNIGVDIEIRSDENAKNTKLRFFINRFSILFDSFGKMDAPFTAVTGNGPDSIDYAAKVSVFLRSIFFFILIGISHPLFVPWNSSRLRVSGESIILIWIFKLLILVCSRS